MADFKKYFPTLLQHEGGYVNHPQDPGGETKYGISKRAYPGEDIQNLTKERAEKLYYSDYWRPLRLDEFVSQSLSEIVFDHAVNAGKRSAIIILQKILNTTTDGLIGAKTLTAANTGNLSKIFELYKSERIVYYNNLVKSKPSLNIFLRGWSNRVNKFNFKT